MTCKELVELVTDYLEGKLDGVVMTRFEQHLATCDGCTGYLEQMRQTINAMGYLHEVSLTPRQRRHLLMVFRDWKRN